MVEVIDNFLPKDIFVEMQYKILANDFPWYYNNGIVGPHQKNKYQFVHTFFNCDINFSNLHNEYYNFIDPCLHKLGVKHLKRVKANLNPRSAKIIRHGFHIDVPEEWADDVTTSIYYVNSNNGYTEFEDGTKIESVENRLVSFPAKMRHSGTTCTDKQARVVINFNYF